MLRLQAIGSQPLGFEMVRRSQPWQRRTHARIIELGEKSNILAPGRKLSSNVGYFLAVSKSEILSYSRRVTTPRLTRSSGLAYGRLAMIRSAVAAVIPGKLSSCSLLA